MNDLPILPLIVTLIGAIMSFLGMKWLIISLRAKEITQIKTSDRNKSFYIGKPGLYCLCIMGVRQAKNSGNFLATIYDTIQTIDLKENSIKVRFSTLSRKGVEYATFRIDQAGNYNIRFENIEHLRLGSRQAMDPEVMIKETIPAGKKVAAIIMLALGINILAWGVIIIFLPELIKLW